MENNNSKAKNWPLLVGISLPIIFIIIVSAFVFIPTLLVKPEHNFLYTTSNVSPYDNYYKNGYFVSNGSLSLEEYPIRPNLVLKGDMPPLYLYDVKTDSSHLISFQDAQKYTLDPGPTSPDGYVVDYEYGNAGIFDLFGSNREGNGYFIKKNSGKKRLSGIQSDYPYYYEGNFKLLGWIK